MPDSGYQRVAFKVLTLGALSTCLFVLSGVGKLAGQQDAAGRRATDAEISVAPQPDAPLRITVLSHNLTDPRTPEIIYEVTNVSARPIRAYTVAQETLRGGEKSAGSVLTDLDLSNIVLQPGQYSTENITYQPLSERSSQITLSVDFVEFGDGTTWGPNSYKSAGMLAGQRAGAVEAGKRLLQVYKSEGRQAALKLLETSPVGVTPPQEHGSEWVEGFRHGYSFMANRLKRLLNNGDMNKLDDELRRLSDKWVRSQ